jgi:hypothetical protein
LKLANWFEIDEMEYIEYQLKGYTITADEDKVKWQLDGQLHRTNGPALIWADGDRVWCLNGQFHRTDGPAVIYANGDQEWWLNGMKLTKDEWRQQVETSQLV